MMAYDETSTTARNSALGETEPRHLRHMQHHLQGPPGLESGRESGSADSDFRHAVDHSPASRAETASLCRGAATLIRQRGWDPLAESWSPVGPLPMDVAIFSVAENRGCEHLDDILDVVLTHIAGTLYAVGDVTQQMLVHDLTDVAMAWEARPDRSADEVLAMLDLTASILGR
jgi:hypothetical protein